MYNIRKGSIIEEYDYGVIIEAEIITEVQEVNGNQQQFTAKLISVDYGEGKRQASENSMVDYLVGGTYGASIQVVKY